MYLIGHALVDGLSIGRVPVCGDGRAVHGIGVVVGRVAQHLLLLEIGGVLTAVIDHDIALRQVSVQSAFFIRNIKLNSH